MFSRAQTAASPEALICHEYTNAELMFPGIGIVVFAVVAGEAELVRYDPTDEYNPYLKMRLPICRDGWHIVRRVR